MITSNTITRFKQIICYVVLHEWWTVCLLAVVRSEMQRGTLQDTVYLGPNINDAQNGALIHAHQSRGDDGPEQVGRLEKVSFFDLQTAG